MSTLSRRAVLSGSALALPALAANRSMAASTDPFTFEVTRDDTAWRALLGDDVFGIMREGKTEAKYASPLTEETRDGDYCCKGCELTLYTGRWKRSVDKGYVFFAQSEPDAMLMSIDQAIPDDAVKATADERRILDDSAAIEVHCRRCGSHIGHILIVDGALLHCSNGTALEFQPSDT